MKSMPGLSVRPIKDFCLGIYDGPHATPKESSSGAIFLGISNITHDGKLDLTDVKCISLEELPKWTRRVIPQFGDVVFTYEATLHRYALIPEDFQGCLGRRVALVRPDSEQADSHFLLYYFLSERWRTIVEGSIVSGATVDRIPLEKFPSFPVSLPSLAAQRKIVRVLKNYDDLIENNRRRMAKLEEAARLLYQEWFVRLRFPGHEHTRIVNGVPAGWSKPTLQAVCMANNGIQTGPFGSQLHQSDYTESGVPVVMPKDIIGFRIISDSIARIPEELANSLGRHRLQEGDVVYGRRGDIGRRAFVSARQAGWFCGTGCLRLRPDPDAIDPRYFFDALGSPETAGTIAGRAKGATMLNLNASVMADVSIIVPEYSLQKSYAKHATQMSLMIECLAIQNEKLRTARDLLLPRLMSGEIAA